MPLPPVILSQRARRRGNPSSIRGETDCHTCFTGSFRARGSRRVPAWGPRARNGDPPRSGGRVLQSGASRQLPQRGSHTPRWGMAVSFIVTCLHMTIARSGLPQALRAFAMTKWGKPHRVHRHFLSRSGPHPRHCETGPQAGRGNPQPPSPQFTPKRTLRGEEEKQRSDMQFSRRLRKPRKRNERSLLRRPIPVPLPSFPASHANADAALPPGPRR